MSGTERQHVAFDYARLLAAGRADAEQLVSAALADLTGFTPSGAAGYAFCELVNVSICGALEAGRPTLLLVHQPQSHASPSKPIMLSVGFPAGVASWAVLGPDGKTPITAQLLPLSRRDQYLRETYYGYDPAGAEVQWLAFQAPLPAMGYSAFFLMPSASTADAPHTHASSLRTLGRLTDEVLTNGLVSLTIAAATGTVAGYTNSASGITMPLTQSFLYYRASVGGPNDGTGASSYGQAATTYIMRPNSSTPFAVGGGQPVAVEMLSGPVVNEARQYTGPNDWMCATLRLWANDTVIQVRRLHRQALKSPASAPAAALAFTPSPPLPRD